MISFLILSTRGTGRLVCIPRILVGASLEVGVTSLMRRILEVCSWRLIACRGGYIMSDREKLLQILTFPLMMIDMIVTGPGQGLPLVSPSHMMRVTIISAEIRAHLVKV